MNEETVNDFVRVTGLPADEIKAIVPFLGIAYSDALNFYLVTERWPRADEAKVIQLFGYNAWHTLYHTRTKDLTEEKLNSIGLTSKRPVKHG